MAEGDVISQSPAAGTGVQPGSTVTLTFSSGWCPVIVPTATSCAAITAAGLVCSTTSACSNTVAQGSVISQSPAAGTGVQHGSTVTLTISSGPCQVAVPAATSCTAITAAGLTCSTTSACSNTVAQGGVISQSPAAGTMVNPGTTVTLTLSSGPCAVQLATPQNVKATDVVLTSATDPLQNHNLNDRVTVTWSAVANANSYEIYRATSATGTYALIGTVTAPTTTYNDLQSETLTFPTLLAGNTAANIDANEAAVRPIIRDFKNYKYYKVKACSTSPYYTNSSLSAYDEGRMDYTLEEFFRIAQMLVSMPLGRIMLQDTSIGVGTNETYYDPCGDGKLHFTVTLSGLQGLLTLAFTNYIDSMNYSSPTIDCNGTRKLIYNGSISGKISMAGAGTLTGSVAFTGNFAGVFSSISIGVTNSTPQTGTCTVQYNGEQVAGHSFGF